MAKQKKKSGKQDNALQAIIFLTAILDFTKTLIDLINRLIK